MNHVKVCPKCGSIDISYQTGAFGKLGERTFFDRCNECNYVGMVPEVEKSKVKEFRQRIKNKKAK